MKGWVCNWQIDFLYKDSMTGKEYMRERGKAIPECGGLLQGLRESEAEDTSAELWVNGKFRAAQCHSITR